MYKVVRKQRGRLYSATLAKSISMSSDWDHSKKWRVRYIPNEWVKAEIGNLFVFNNLGDAVSFVAKILTIRFINEIEIWQCRTKNSKKTYKMVVSPSNFLKFWTEIPTNPPLNIAPPQGTFTTSEVMLTKRVRTCTITREGIKLSKK